MNKSELFRKAHALTKQIIQAGDDYRATFGAALKFVRENSQFRISFTMKAFRSRVTREFTSQADFVKYCSAALLPELNTYEAALAHCQASSYITVTFA